MKFLIFTFHKPSVVTNAGGKDSNVEVNAYMTTKFYTVNWYVVGYAVLTGNSATEEVVRWQM